MIIVLSEHEDLNVCYSDQNEGNVHSLIKIHHSCHHASTSVPTSNEIDLYYTLLF